MIIAINFDEKINPQFELNDSAEFLLGLKKINLFVGSNNSGKSRLIRELFAKKDIPLLRKDFDRKKYTEYVYPELNASISRAINQSKSNGICFIDEKEFINILKDSVSSEPQRAFSDVLSIIHQSKRITKSEFIVNETASPSAITQAVNAFNEIRGRLGNSLNNLFENQNNINKLYIPVLRGLRPIQFTEENKFTNTDVYFERTQFDYGIKQNNQLQIYTGLSIYEDVMKLLLGTESDRKEIAEFEDFLSEIIFSEKVTLIPKYKDDVLHIKIGDSRQFEIYNLGDGLQTIIAILYLIFTKRNSETQVFIEEPETHLHPAWQIKLINALKSFEKHQFFIATHSASFINDPKSSIYTVQKVNEKSIISHANLDSQKASAVQELGYKPSDLFLTNYILWVEGPSDKIYFEYWIKKVAPNLIIGYHYNLMFYGGSTYEHFLKDGDEFSLSFIQNINQNFGIILDSDRINKHQQYSKQKKKIKDIFEKNNSFCWLTKFREIENYIPLTTFEESVKKVHKKENITIATGNYDDRNTVIDIDAPISYKPRIKIPDEIFSTIQRNRDGTTKGIPAKDLRKNIELAINDTKKVTFNIDKVKVAKEVVSQNPALTESELNKMLRKLVRKIKRANNI